MSAGCPETDAVQAYVDGAATLGERAAIEEHVRACGACRDVLMLAGTWQSEPAAAGAPVAILGRSARIDRFVVDGVLGAGGMGVVYSARDPELEPVSPRVRHGARGARRGGARRAARRAAPRARRAGDALPRGAPRRCSCTRTGAIAPRR